jgi:Fe-S oxidoreductase
MRTIFLCLAKEFEAGHIDATLVAVADHLMVHGHCHQKALHSTTPMKAVLSKTSATVSEIPSGCCGMAGSFGYEREHYALSEKIGEMVLFPSVRSRKEGTVVVANGFSCRHQIEHFTGVKPRHWVEVVRTTSASSQ